VATDSSGAASTLDPALQPLAGLMGTWEGRDADRHTSGRFSLRPEVGGKALLRRNVNETPNGRHEDLMVLFHAPTGLRASYVDNEGHVIAYAVTASGDHVELLSDEAPGQPRFRLTYEMRPANELAIDFAIAMPGSTEFKHYTGGVVHRVAP
jgi:hypothetical protein